jgi:2-keto-3-deoxy-L-rhamnonate aldolase RhmA
MKLVRPSVLQKRLRGDGANAIWLSLGSAAIAEMAGLSRPDAVVFDAQHGLWDRQSLEAGIGAVRSLTVPLVRVAENTPLAIGQALDAGAGGVIVPLVETAAEAASAVSAAHYPPGGNRSGGGVRPLIGGFGAYIQWAKHVVCAVMIETLRGLENCHEIAATSGVDMVFIGTGDLALSLGMKTQRIENACSSILKQCRASGTPCGRFTNDPAEAALRRKQGYAFVTVASDITVVGNGFAAATSPPAARGQRR